MERENSNTLGQRQVSSSPHCWPKENPLKHSNGFTATEKRSSSLTAFSYFPLLAFWVTEEMDRYLHHAFTWRVLKPCGYAGRTGNLVICESRESLILVHIRKLLHLHGDDNSSPAVQLHHWPRQHLQHEASSHVQGCSHHWQQERNTWPAWVCISGSVEQVKYIRITEYRDSPYIKCFTSTCSLFSSLLL